MHDEEAVGLETTLAGMRAALAKLDVKREQLAEGIRVVEEMLAGKQQLGLPAIRSEPTKAVVRKAPEAATAKAQRAPAPKSSVPMKHQAMQALRSLEPTLHAPHARVEYETLIVDAGGPKFEKPTMFRALEAMVKVHDWVKREKDPGKKPRRFVYGPRRIFEAQSAVSLARFATLEQDDES